MRLESLMVMFSWHDVGIGAFFFFIFRFISSWLAEWNDWMEGKRRSQPPERAGLLSYVGLGLFMN